MTAIEQIIEAFELALSLERELGVRAVECDRALLTPRPAGGDGENGASGALRATRPTSADGNRMQSNAIGRMQSTAIDGNRNPPPPPAPRPPTTLNSKLPTPNWSLVFLHDGPMLRDSVEKIIRPSMEKLGLTDANAKVVTDGPIPPAKVIVVMGAKALRKWFPGVAAGPGQWIATKDGVSAVVTYTPDKITRYKSASPAVKAQKKELWNAFKSANQRIS